MTMGLFECHSLSQIILTVPIKKKSLGSLQSGHLPPHCTDKGPSRLPFFSVTVEMVVVVVVLVV